MTPKKLLGVLLVACIALGCTRDDICPEDTPTTPLLIVTFKDFADGQTPKSVPNLQVLDAFDTSIQVLGSATTDSIAIPLRNFNDNTQFLFIKDSNSEDPEVLNADRIQISYTLRDVYVNRACGFIANYDDLGVLLDDSDDDTWIISLQTLVNTIDNQDETHITILH
ncbi:MAG: DUF6452 family protein [Gilvibacter sp.]